MRATDIIMKKRGIKGQAIEPLNREEIEFIVNSYVRGEIPEYQISAWPFMFARLATYHDREAVREMEASMDAGTVSKADAASSAGMYKAVYREAGEHARMLRFNICFLFGTLLMVTINSAIWRQTHGWIAGFSNFVVSALFIELFFFIFIWGGSKPLEYKNELSK